MALTAGWAILIALIVFAVLGFILIWTGLLVTLKFMRDNPKCKGVFLNDDGTFETYNLATTDMMGKKWIFSEDAREINFNIFPKGVGKKVPKKWRKGNYTEIPDADGKKLVLFGLHNLEKGLSDQLERSQDTVNKLITSKILLENKHIKLKIQFDKEIKRRQEEIKYLMPIPFMPPKSKK